MRNRLTISCLAITVAQAFFNARLRQCPNSNILLTAPLSSFAAVHVRSSGNTIGHSSNVASTPPAASKARRLTHRTISSFRLPPYRARDTATSSPPLLGLQPGRDSGTTAGIYDLRRLKAKHCAEPVGEARRSAWPLPLHPTFLDIRHFLGSSHPTKCPGARKTSVAAALEICHRKNAAATGLPEFVRPVSAAGLVPESEASRCDRCFAES